MKMLGSLCTVFTLLGLAVSWVPLAGGAILAAQRGLWLVALFLGIVNCCWVVALGIMFDVLSWRPRP